MKWNYVKKLICTTYIGWMCQPASSALIIIVSYNPHHRPPNQVLYSLPQRMSAQKSLRTFQSHSENNCQSWDSNSFLIKARPIIIFCYHRSQENTSIDQTDMMPGFVNKVLLEQSHAHLFLYCLRLLPQYHSLVEQLQQRSYSP